MPHFANISQLRVTKLWLLGISLIALTLAGCVSIPARPKSVNNACSIFAQYPHWYKAAKKAEQRWGTPVSTQLAVMHQESNFIGNAKPPRQKLLWVVPWARPSSSYGYAQALESTWNDYKRATGSRWAQRDSFKSSADFISWYFQQIHLQTGIPITNVYALYLAYHDGVNGYLHGTYRRKKWLINVAKRVQYRASVYKRQLRNCAKRL